VLFGGNQPFQATFFLRLCARASNPAST